MEPNDKRKEMAFQNDKIYKADLQILVLLCKIYKSTYCNKYEKTNIHKADMLADRFECKPRIYYLK